MKLPKWRPVAGGLLVIVLALASAGLRPAPEVAEGRGPRPRLVVLISVDGLGWYWLDHYRPWYVAGLKRLLDESLVETACRYRHLNTETGPGHSSLSTGAPPRVTGIVANRWFEQGPDGTIRALNCVDQSTAGGAPGDPRTIPGPGNLRVPTFGDRLLEKSPTSRVVSLSAKDRSAIFMAGHNANHTVFWYDQESGRFTTSAAYDPPKASRAVVAHFNATLAGATLPGRFGLAWSRLPPPEPPSVLPLPRPTPVPNLADYQIPSDGLGWDHPLASNPRGYFANLYYSPFVDDLVADLALAFVDDDALALGRQEAPDVLELSFSAQDVVSHSYGAESEENLDVLRRLDLHIGRVLGALDRKYGKKNLILAFSADHGFPLIPEARHAREASFKGGRVLTSDRGLPTFVERLNRLIDLDLCLPADAKVIFGIEGLNMIYNRPAFPLRTVAGECGAPERTLTTADVDRVVPGVLKRFFDEEVEAVYLASQRDRWPANAPVTEFVSNDFDPDRSGDAILVLREGVMTHWDPARGANHGSQYDYDTHVPLLFWGGTFQSKTSGEDTTPYDVAPTFAAALGISLEHAVGHSRLLSR